MVMLIQLLLTAFLFFGIFFVTRRFSALLFLSAYRLTGNKRLAIWIVAIVLLPGTIAHELSHFLAATLFRVPTGHMSIFPNLKHIKEGKQDISMGHIQIAQTGPFRHTLIGIAPITAGLTILYLFGTMISRSQPILLFVICYMLFVISSTMFTSRSDLRSVIIVAPVVLLLALAVYFAGVRISVTRNLSETLWEIIQRLNFSLAVSAAIDAAILLLLRGLIFCTQKIKRLAKG